MSTDFRNFTFYIEIHPNFHENHPQNLRDIFLNTIENFGTVSDLNFFVWLGDMFGYVSCFKHYFLTLTMSPGNHLKEVSNFLWLIWYVCTAAKLLTNRKNFISRNHYKIINLPKNVTQILLSRNLSKLKSSLGGVFTFDHLRT